MLGTLEPLMSSFNTILSPLTRLWMCMVLLTSLIVVLLTSIVIKADTIDITASVPAPLPEGPAIITAPENNARFRQATVTVSGICPTGGAYVTVTRNAILAGVTSCDNGQFSLPVRLEEGSNELVAQVYNITDNPGPVDGTVTVYYDVPVTELSPILSIPDLLIPTQNPTSHCIPTPILLSHEPYLPVQEQKHWQWTITVQQGCPPYTLTIKWGDTTSETHEIRESTTTLSFGHNYAGPGVYKPLFEVTDTAKTSALLQLLAIINPDPMTENEITDKEAAVHNPLGPYIAAAVVTAAIVTVVAVAQFIRFHLRIKKP